MQTHIWISLITESQKDHKKTRTEAFLPGKYPCKTRVKTSHAATKGATIVTEETSTLILKQVI
jgi:hypothetical protein